MTQVQWSLRVRAILNKVDCHDPMLNTCTPGSEQITMNGHPLRIADESCAGTSAGRQRNSTSNTCSWAAVMIDWQHGAGHFNP